MLQEILAPYLAGGVVTDEFRVGLFVRLMWLVHGQLPLLKHFAFLFRPEFGPERFDIKSLNRFLTGKRLFFHCICVTKFVVAVRHFPGWFLPVGSIALSGLIGHSTVPNCG